MLPEWVPTPRNRRYCKAVVELDAEVMQRIRARRSDSSQRPDLLSMFVQLQNGDGWIMSDRQVRDELIAMMSAGYQSVGIALNQTLRLVAENPSVDAQLAEELAILGHRAPAAADLAQLTYADRIVKESLRCCPPAGVIGRRAVSADTVGGWTIPAGARVYLSAWAMHHDPRFYEAPLAFRPERWTQEFERSLPICAYFPFGRGPRGCIAGALSTFIVQLILVIIAQRYRLEALRVIPARLASWPNFLAQGGLQIAIHPRRSSEVRTAE
jgi:cytochrome P450